MFYSVVLCCAVLCCVVPIVLCCVVLCRLCCVVLCRLCFVVLYHDVTCHVVLFCSLTSPWGSEKQQPSRQATKTLEQIRTGHRPVSTFNISNS